LRAAPDIWIINFLKKKMQDSIDKRGRTNDLVTSVLVVMIGIPPLFCFLYLLTKVIEQVLAFLN